MSAYFLLIPVLVPLLLGTAMVVHPIRNDRRRNLFVFSVTLLTSVMVAALLFFPPGEQDLALKLAGVLEIRFRLDGCGMVFAGLISFLWPLAVVYAFEYMEGGRQNTFFAFYTMTYGVTCGIAFAGNLMTMYMFYELLTIVTIPLVMHELDHKSVVAARKYMKYSFGGAAFGFLGFIAILTLGDTIDFVYGGVLSADAIAKHGTFLLLVYTLAVFGFGVKAAIFPVHGWLPTASVAPTPVTALLHAVAVVKAGAFAIIRITYYSFGTSFLAGSVAQKIILTATAVTIVYGSVKALKEQHVKRRLAYSTVSNLSYILFAAALMSEAGMKAAFLHLVCHGLMKITLFYCIGAIMIKTGRKYLWEMDGIARKMPVIMSVYTVAGIALIGIPPFCGFISKWYIAQAAVQSGAEGAGAFAYLGLAAVMLSAFLTAAYIMQLVIRAWTPVKETAKPSVSAEAAEEKSSEAMEASNEAAKPSEEETVPAVYGEGRPGARMCVPLIILAIAIIVIGLFSGPLADFAAKVAAGLR
ncbi:MAG: proton-conducting membrane transporter [Lachnospiraceae bacterium]|nr:proton-conducting membrane transporter [Lachnospiraceae bacterium]